MLLVYLAAYHRLAWDEVLACRPRRMVMGVGKVASIRRGRNWVEKPMSSCRN